MVKIFVHFLIYWEALPHIYITFTRSHLNYLIYEENFVFFFISVLHISGGRFYIYWWKTTRGTDKNKSYAGYNLTPFSSCLFVLLLEATFLLKQSNKYPILLWHFNEILMENDSYRRNDSFYLEQNVEKCIFFFKHMHSKFRKRANMPQNLFPNATWNF
jgi:hypothetical protein